MISWRQADVLVVREPLMPLIDGSHTGKGFAAYIRDRLIPGAVHFSMLENAVAVNRAALVRPRHAVSYNCEPGGEPTT